LRGCVRARVVTGEAAGGRTGPHAGGVVSAKEGNVQRLGLFLVAAGALGLSWAAIETLLDGPANAGGVAATGLFLVILGMVFWFPTLLSDDTGATSTMRVAVLMVVALFVVLTTKAGWNAPDLEHLKLPETWVWVLAAAFGGKAFQSFAENAPSNGPPRDWPQGKAVPPPPPAPYVPTALRTRDEHAGIEDTP
jgi:hypothetical protein